MTSISYRVEGQGKPLVLFHGWGVTFPIWQNLAPLLASDYTLIMPELPGNGNSDLPPEGLDYFQACALAVEDLRRQLGFNQWAVLGYSIGAWGAWAYLNRNFGVVSKAIFLCPAILHQPSVLGLGLLAHLDRRWPRLGDWLLSGWRIQHLVQTLGFNGRPHPYADLWAENIASQPIQVTKQCLYDLLASSRTPFTLAGKESLFIWAKQDILAVAPRRLGMLERLIPGNHSAPLLQADAIAELIHSFY